MILKEIRPKCENARRSGKIGEGVVTRDEKALIFQGVGRSGVSEHQGGITFYLKWGIQRQIRFAYGVKRGSGLDLVFSLLSVYALESVHRKEAEGENRWAAIQESKRRGQE